MTREIHWYPQTSMTQGQLGEVPFHTEERDYRSSLLVLIRRPKPFQCRIEARGNKAKTLIQAAYQDSLKG